MAGGRQLLEERGAVDNDARALSYSWIPFVAIVNALICLDYVSWNRGNWGSPCYSTFSRLNSPDLERSS